MPVPDNQEVWGGEEGSTIIFELIQQKPEWKDEELAVNAFKDLAETNEAKTSNVISTKLLEKGEFPQVTNELSAIAEMEGVQEVVRGEHADPEQVHVFMVVLRFKENSVDLFISISVPKPNEDSDGMQPGMAHQMWK